MRNEYPPDGDSGEDLDPPFDVFPPDAAWWDALGDDQLDRDDFDAEPEPGDFPEAA